jgi:cell division protein FtsL
VVVDLEDMKRHHNKESIFFANDPIENEKNTVQMANMTRLKQFVKKFRSILLIVLVLCLLAVLGRNIYLEVRVHEYPDEIFSLNKEINELRKYNADLEQKYNQCAYGNDEGGFYGYGNGPQDEDFDERSTFLGVSP